MYWVLGACLPGLAALVSLAGLAPLRSALVAVLSALVWEALVLQLRRRPVGTALADGSAALTGLLLALALAPAAPLWLVITGTGVAVVGVKHLFGGLGQNVFNPAMAAYVLLLVSFPLPMSSGWTATLDAVTGATLLDQHDQWRRGLLELAPTVPPGAGLLAAAWLLGGSVLLLRGVIHWRLPVALLLGLTGSATLGHALGWDAVPLSQHLLAGATLFAALFIITDPVTAPTHVAAQWLFGLLVGMLVWVIRTWGLYPDGIAFAVLLGNLCAPALDLWLAPRRGRP